MKYLYFALRAWTLVGPCVPGLGALALAIFYVADLGLKSQRTFPSCFFVVSAMVDGKWAIGTTVA